MLTEHTMKNILLSCLAIAFVLTSCDDAGGLKIKGTTDVETVATCIIS